MEYSFFNVAHLKIVNADIQGGFNSDEPLRILIQDTEDAVRELLWKSVKFSEPKIPEDITHIIQQLEALSDTVVLQVEEEFYVIVETELQLYNCLIEAALKRDSIVKFGSLLSKSV